MADDSKWKDSRAAGALRGAGSALSEAGRDESARADRPISQVTYHRGGKVRKGGSARLLKGERVIPRGKVKRVEKLMKRNGMGLKAKKGRNQGRR